MRKSPLCLHSTRVLVDAPRRLVELQLEFAEAPPVFIQTDRNANLLQVVFGFKDPKLIESWKYDRMAILEKKEGVRP